MKQHVLLSGTIKRIHVNQRSIRSNLKNGTTEPVITVQHKGRPTRAHTVKINGPSEVIYSPCNPLSCGARLWIETKSQVTITTEGE